MNSIRVDLSGRFIKSKAENRGCKGIGCDNYVKRNFPLKIFIFIRTKIEYVSASLRGVQNAWEYKVLNLSEASC